VIKFRIGKSLHTFTVENGKLIHVASGQEVAILNDEDEHPCHCAIQSVRVGAIAALNRLLEEHGADELNRRWEQ